MSLTWKKRVKRLAACIAARLRRHYLSRNVSTEVHFIVVARLCASTLDERERERECMSIEHKTNERTNTATLLINQCEDRAEKCRLDVRTKKKREQRIKWKMNGWNYDHFYSLSERFSSKKLSYLLIPYWLRIWFQISIRFYLLNARWLSQNHNMNRTISPTQYNP